MYKSLSKCKEPKVIPNLFLKCVSNFFGLLGKHCNYIILTKVCRKRCDINIHFYSKSHFQAIGC